MLSIISQIGLLFYPLLGLSLAAMVLIIDRAIFFYKLPKLEEAKSYKLFMAELENNKNLSKPVRDELISFRLIDLQNILTHGVYLLRLVAVLSPMLGLLGTVLGMIEAFRDISTQTGPVAPSMIADGLWSAMLTTAYGLSIALPCLFAAFIYARMAEKRLDQFQKRLNAKSLIIEGVKLNEKISV